MTERLLFRSASSTDHSTYTGVRGEVTIDSTNNNLIVHDGVTSGGNFPTIADGSLSITAFASSIKPVEIVSSLPTSDNEDGRMVFLTVDKKLYRYDSSAGSFTAEVSTSDLTGTISGAQIAAGSIVAGHITSDSITTGMIQTGAITADEIASNAITAGAILTGALTLTKMSDSELVTNNVTVELGAGVSFASTYDAGGSFVSDDIGTYGLICANEASGHGMAAGTQAFGTTYAGLVAIGGANSTWTTWRTLGEVGTGNSALLGIAYNSSYSQSAYVEIAKGGYSIYTSVGELGPFTGSHDVLIPDVHSLNVGDILVDTDVLVKKGISDTLTTTAPSTSSSQKGAIGVFTRYAEDNHVPAALSVLIDEGMKSDREIDSQYASLLVEHKLGVVNALGEGQINCVGEGGNLEIGDLIVTSSTQGKGMKQTDDILRSMTVAKSRENVNFENGEVKLVACIYLCG